MATATKNNDREAAPVEAPKPKAVALREEKPQGLPLEFKDRTALCKGTHRSNCVGTALFILGRLEEDYHIEPNEANKYLEPLSASYSLSVGCLVGWHSRLTAELIHLAVVTSVDPRLITHRTGINGKFIENQPFHETDGELQGSACDPVVYCLRSIAEP
jgi:hypothetical protein